MTRDGPPDFVAGDTFGLAIPTHPAAFRNAGAEFPTSAFRRFGALATDNAIARIVRLESCIGGGTGKKLFLTVEYARPDPSLDCELFVKFSRDFGDAIRDVQRHEMRSEVRLGRLSRHPAFPIAVPATYFADWHEESGSGLLIAGRVRRLNLAYAIWGCLLAAPLAVWDKHLDELLALFVAELAAGGGPRLPVEELKLHLRLYVAQVGLALAIVAPDRIVHRLPEAVRASGPRDPVFARSEPARNFLHVFTVFLNFWETHDFGRSLDRMLERS